MPRFTITTLLWLTALFATGMGTFRPALGLALASMVCVYHALVWGRVGCREIVAIGGIAIALVILAFATLSYPQEHAHQHRSVNNLKVLTLALLNHEMARNAFPPSYSINMRGEPLHSWRTFILSYLEEQTLLDSIKIDEPWDSPANAKLLDGLEIEWFRSPRRPVQDELRDEANYFVVVDDEAILQAGQGARFTDITDGASKTILLLEAAGRGVRWHEPQDLTMEEAIDLLTGDADETHEWVEPGFFASTRYRGDGLWPRNVAFADGHVQSIGRVTSRELARALLTRAGGEEIPEDFDTWEHDRSAAVIGHTVHRRRVLSTTLFVGLAVGPCFRRSTGREE